MKTLYIECSMGASGDMLQGALADLMGCGDEFAAEMNSLGLDNVEIRCERKEKCGITGEKISVLISGCEEGDMHKDENHHHDHSHNDAHHHHHHCENHCTDHHSHNSLSYIEDIIDGLEISETVKRNSKAVFSIIADAESKVHGKPIDNIHFHEVGSIDAVCDIVGFGILMEKLGADRVIVSPINTGRGNVKCAHGILPVPAPATALILKGIPCYSNEVWGELCTPTGAALLKYYASEFAERGSMTYTEIGYGLGTKDFEAANIVRVFLCEEDDKYTDTVIRLELNLDDMTAEDVAYAQRILFDNGALEVYTVPAMMKKSRQGLVMTCLCKECDREKMLSIIFDHTSTIGVRESVEKRYVLKRRIETMDTSLGAVCVKISEGYDVRRYKIEHDCLIRIAEKYKLSVSDVRAKLQKELNI